MARRFERYVAPARARAQLWRTGLGSLGILAVWMIGSAAIVTALAVLTGAVDPATQRVVRPVLEGRTPADMMTLLASFAALGLGVVLVTRLLHGRGLSSLMGAGWGLEWLRAILCFGLVAGASALLGGPGDGPPALRLDPALWLGLLVPALALVALQTLSEELAFRGYLMQQLGARFRSPLAWLLLPALLFGLGHVTALPGPDWPRAVAAITLFALVMGDLTRRHGNLGAAWGLHMGNNAYLMLVVAPAGPMTGMALYTLPESAAELMASDAVLLQQLGLYLVLWGLLRRPLPR